MTAVLYDAPGPRAIARNRLTGVIGTVLLIAIAYILSTLVKMFTPVPSQVPISAVILSLVVSAGVGLFFGLYPANRAAKLDPIEALRFET